MRLAFAQDDMPQLGCSNHANTWSHMDGLLFIPTKACIPPDLRTEGPLSSYVLNWNTFGKIFLIRQASQSCFLGSCSLCS